MVAATNKSILESGNLSWFLQHKYSPFGLQKVLYSYGDSTVLAASKDEAIKPTSEVNTLLSLTKRILVPVALRKGYLRRKKLLKTCPILVDISRGISIEEHKILHYFYEV